MSEVVSQKKATLNTLLAVLEDRGVNYELNGEQPIRDVLSRDDKSQARDMLFTMFREGQVQYKESFQSKVDDDTELKKYINGLVNNWIRKAPELNCGETYKPKNPGSRTGSQDPEVREMKKLLNSTADPDAKAEIQKAIDEKVAQIKAEKNKVEIDADKLPEHLQHLVKED